MVTSCMKNSPQNRISIPAKNGEVAKCTAVGYPGPTNQNWRYKENIVTPHYDTLHINTGFSALTGEPRLLFV